MDRTLILNPLIARRLRSRITSIGMRPGTLPAFFICLMAPLLFSGCQTTGLQSTAIPAPPPPPTLNTAQLDNVRYQSPDQEDNRVLSRNRLEFDQPLRDAMTTGSGDQEVDSSQQHRVAEIIIEGNRTLPTHQIRKNMRTRPGRFFDPDLLQQDVNQLWRMPEISRVKGPFLQRTEAGVVIKIDVEERPMITQVEFIGNRGIPDRTLKKETGLEDGRPLDVHQIRMAKTRLEELYKEKGYPRTQVEIMEGNEDNDNKVVFVIHEDEKQRIWKVSFEGNSIATDARLKSFIESKPGVLKVFGGLVNRDEIEQDITRLVNYYRSLGFFNAQIGREISESNDGRWLTLRFIINEGPRYKVRNVSFMGNQSYNQDQLGDLIELKPTAGEMPEFNVAKMNRDVTEIRELYGSQGFIMANIEAEPRFLEEPGMLDIVYKISEGKQFVVGDINIHYVGGAAITKREVILNRIACRPGELVDYNKIRTSERLLGASQIFAVGGATGGARPRIAMTPSKSDYYQRYARANQSRSMR